MKARSNAENIRRAREKVANARQLLQRGYCPGCAAPPSKEPLEVTQSESGQVLLYRCLLCRKAWRPTGHRYNP